MKVALSQQFSENPTAIVRHGSRKPDNMTEISPGNTRPGYKRPLPTLARNYVSISYNALL